MVRDQGLPVYVSISLRFIWEIGPKLVRGEYFMKGMWTAALHDPLAFAFSDGQAASRPDVLIHKNRNWGMSDSMTTCTDYLKMEVFGHSNLPG